MAHTPCIPGFRRDFWARTTVRALDPIVSYIGPLPQGPTEMAAMQSVLVTGDNTAFVYVIADTLDTLYVGKTVNPAGRLSSHRIAKEWWPTTWGLLVLLGVEGTDRTDAEAAALYLERQCIQHRRPLYNILGVPA